VIEGDDVGGAVMIEPAPIECDHPGQREQVEAEGVSVEAELVFEEVTGGMRRRGGVRMRQARWRLRIWISFMGRFCRGVPRRHG
jgi:hypothetical protein